MRLGRRPRYWSRRGVGSFLALPLAALFGLVAAIRRRCYRSGCCRAVRLPLPVVVVGNISVGGSGKTPLVLWLAAHLRAAGWQPGIVSRGFGGTLEQGDGALVTADSTAAEVGDEPLLLARLAGCPVAVGAQRAKAAQCLLAAHPQCDVLISDDGLQHYALARTLEIAVVDEATLGNRHLLPAGPLREPLRRLAEVDLIVAHGPLSADVLAAGAAVPVARMRLQGDRLHALHDSAHTRPLAAFAGQHVHAVAGIGLPERFFAHLRAAGLQVEEHAFADHHVFVAADFHFQTPAPCLMTTKDAVKCRDIAPQDSWVLPVDAELSAFAAQWIVEKLSDGRPIA